jgi:hypothetical protein
MKRVTIILLICVCLLVVVLVGYSRIYLVDINNLYNLKYGARFIPVIEQLCTIKGINYLYGPDLLYKDSVSVLVYIPPSIGNEIHYANLFLLTKYINIGDP